MVEDAVTTKAFEIMRNKGGNATIEDMTDLRDLKFDSSSRATLEDRLTAALLDLGITDKCRGFVIDGDMAMKMADYFKEEHLGSRSVRWYFKPC